LSDGAHSHDGRLGIRIVKRKRSVAGGKHCTLVAVVPASSALTPHPTRRTFLTLITFLVHYTMASAQETAAQLQAATEGFDNLFRDEMTQAREVFSAGTHPFQLMGLGVCSFMEAALGMEVRADV
jgi:hypothetical protein